MCFRVSTGQASSSVYLTLIICEDVEAFEGTLAGADRMIRESFNDYRPSEGADLFQLHRDFSDHYANFIKNQNLLLMIWSLFP